MNDIVLFDYPKSSASYRVRIALNLARLSYRKENVDLLDGAQKSDEHLMRNPQGLVPVLDIDGQRLTQSLAILNYLDQTRNIGLLPNEPVTRAKVEALAMAIAVDLHPVCNLSVVGYATGGKDPARTDWMKHFITKGLAAFEKMLEPFGASPFTTGGAPSLPDICLMPQLYNAKRWGADYSNLKRIVEVERQCQEIDAFRLAHPDNQSSEISFK